MARSRPATVQEKVRQTVLYGTLAIPVVALLLASRLMPALVDEAYVTFRYADMFGRGLGLRFDRFSEPLEGFTSPLWTALLTLAQKRLGTNRLPTVATLLGLLALTGCVALLLRLGRLREETTFASGAWARVFPAVLWCLSAWVVGSASTGTEIVLLVLCLLAIHGGLAGTTPRLLALFAALLIPWVRLEGLWVVMAGAVQLHFQEDRNTQLRRVGLPVLAALIVSAVNLELVRHRVFHAWWPTYLFAHRPSLHAGLHALAHAASSPVVWLTLLAGLLGAAWGDRLHRSLLAGAIAWVPLVALDTGEPGPVRLLLPALALTAAAAGGLGRALSARRFSLVALLVLVIAVSADAFVELDSSRNPIALAESERESNILWLRKTLVSSVSLSEVGEVAYLQPNTDIYDLDNRIYQRSRELVDFPRRAQLVILRLRAVPDREGSGQLVIRSEDGVSAGERAVLADPALKKEYRLLFVAKPEWEHGYARAFYGMKFMRFSPLILPRSDLIDLAAFDATVPG